MISNFATFFNNKTSDGFQCKFPGRRHLSHTQTMQRCRSGQKGTRYARPGKIDMKSGGQAERRIDPPNAA